MTTICENCGTENHMEETVCKECGHPIKKNVEYILCATCGLSNPSTATKCIGCSEPLSAEKVITIEEEIEGKEPILSEESSGVYIPEEKSTKKPLLPENWRRYFLMGSGAIVLLVVLVLAVNRFLFTSDFLEPTAGFYYINQSHELHVINDHQKDILIKQGVSELTKFAGYGDRYYFLSQGELYVFEDESILIDQNVSSFKVDFKGRRVLYTKAIDDSETGDLYLYENETQSRIDAGVGIDRYAFGNSDANVYYVNDITAEENLGILYRKTKQEAPVKLADDVYAPLVSLKKNTVYFTRSDVMTAEKYEVYYVSSGRITEIGRNIKHVILDPKDEMIYLIQEKDNAYTIYQSKRESVELVDNEITALGFLTYGDIDKALIFKSSFNVFYKKASEATFYFDGSKKTAIKENFNAFWLSDDGGTIILKTASELKKAEFKKGMLSEILSIASQSDYIGMSHDGESIIINNGNAVVLLEDGVQRVMPNGSSDFTFSDNDKYLLYFINEDCYVQKLSANEPVYLGEQISDALLLDKYVYTFTDEPFYRYKLGRFSSTKEIDVVKEWALMELAY